MSLALGALLFFLTGALLLWCKYAPMLTSRTLISIVLMLCAWIAIHEHTDWRSWSALPNPFTSSRDGSSAADWWTEGCEVRLFPLRPLVPPKALHQAADNLARGLKTAGYLAISESEAPGHEHVSVALSKWLRSAVGPAYEATSRRTKAARKAPPRPIAHNLLLMGELPHNMSDILSALEAAATFMREDRHILADVLAVHDRYIRGDWRKEVAGRVAMVEQLLRVATKKAARFEVRVNWTLSELEHFRQETMYEALDQPQLLDDYRTESLGALMYSAHLSGLLALFRHEYKKTRNAMDDMAHLAHNPVSRAILRRLLQKDDQDGVWAYDLAVRRFLGEAFAPSSTVGSESRTVRECIAEKCAAWKGWYFSVYRTERHVWPEDVIIT